MKMKEEEKHGRVIEVRKNSYLIDFEGQEISAKLKGSFYDEAPEKWPVVGDYVSFLYHAGGGSLIQSVDERTSFLRRLDPAKTGELQGMAANVDTCFIVTALDEDFRYNRRARYARYVSVALQGGARPVVILTKADLCPDPERYLREVESVSDQVRVYCVSALQGTGLEELKEYFAPGKTVCLMGSSGAGKSTLINTIVGEEIMKTGAVRQSDSSGRHTTTHRQLIKLKNGAALIDTPGMRELGMAGTEEGIDRTFSDIRELAGRCRFSNCRHDTEPGCAVKAALARGELSWERLALYQKLGSENSSFQARRKQISKLARAVKKEKTREIT